MDDLGTVKVVGVSFYQPALERCAAGQAVRFVHEPDNPYDETALRVVSLTGETIGYLPRRSWVHQAVHERGLGVSGVIASIGYSRTCLLGATLSCAVCDDDVERGSYYPDRAPPEPPRGGFRYWISNRAAGAQHVTARQ